MKKTTQIIDTSKRQRLIRKLCPYILLVAISLPALLLRLDDYPPAWFDEGYRTNTARTLAERGVYGTYTVAGYYPFDPGISTGPADIAALALSFKLFGMGVAQARFAIVPFALLAICSLYAIAVNIYGYPSALFSLLILLAVPAIQDVSLVSLGRQVMGEIPALAMIALGQWFWFKSWQADRWLALAALAGLTLGIGLLSKTQIAIALLPTLVLIASFRGLGRRSELYRLFTPVMITVGVMAGWKLLEWLATPESMRQLSSLALSDAIRTNLLTGLWGRTLSRSSIFLFVMMMLGAATSGWRLLAGSHKSAWATDSQWAEATLCLFVVLSAVWFAFISIGWPRYAFIGFVISMILIGKTVWDTFERVCDWLGRYKPDMSRRAYPLAIVGLSVLVVATNTYPLLRFKGNNAAQQVGDYIRINISREAILESWDWQVDALSGHWNYHHPDTRYLYLAHRQFSHDRIAFDLGYDTLQANPDYLVIGPFGEWTNIYGTAETLKAHFTELVEIGPYRVYKRIR